RHSLLRNRRRIHSRFSKPISTKKSLHAESAPKKIAIQMSTLSALFRLSRVEANQTTKKKGKTMNPLTRFKRTKILRNISLGVFFTLAIPAHAQILYVSANAPGSHKIL